MKKLSKTQIEVIKLMRDGWQIGESTRFFSGGYSWIQKGGVGKGGESKKISSSSVFSLYKRKLIYALEKDRFPTTKYELTELGKTIPL